MSTHKYFDRIVCVVVVLALLLTVLFMNGEALGIPSAERTMGYENSLFDYTRVHTIDIVADGWEEFLQTCTDEEYITCAAVIDGEAYKNIAIRAKGNTSLSSVKNYGNDRYSFKLEFDHYDSGITYHGLDKLCLNNLIQDNTLMKDFLVYRMMAEMGVPAPLCSFAFVTVNGADWGLYLAVEAVEDSFLQRNYGSDHGELYKPDSMSFGGGRGNGKDFDMDEFTAVEGGFDPSKFFGGDFDFGEITENLPDEIKEQMPEEFDPSQMFGGDGSFDFGGMPQMGGFDPSQMNGGQRGERPQNSESGERESSTLPEESGERGDRTDRENGGFGGFGGGFGGMGSSDVKLQYTDDDPDSYSNIFGNAKTDVSEADEQRLIAALKRLGESDASAVDTEDVIMYFVVHNFVCNGDSYTGGMIHNYYLYEEDGVLSMLPWDYNLAFGAFDGGNDATSVVNAPIDTPVSGTTGEGDRPMVAWIFSDEQYTELYHEYFGQFLNDWFVNGRAEQLISDTVELIAPYVEKDPTGFCTYEEFISGAEALKEFVALRAESVQGQLDGTIPATADGQNGSDALIDASHISIAAMGSMGDMGGHGGRPDDIGGRPDRWSDGNLRPEDQAGAATLPDGIVGMPPHNFYQFTQP